MTDEATTWVGDGAGDEDWPLLDGDDVRAWMDCDDEWRPCSSVGRSGGEVYASVPLDIRESVERVTLCPGGREASM